MELTPSEVRLILRRHKTWHKLMRRIWYVLSGLALLAIIFVPTIMYLQAQKMLAYQNSIAAIQAVARTGTQPTFFIPADQYAQRFITTSTEEARLAADYVNIFMKKSDSFGLTADKRLGMRLEITVVPTGLFGRRHSAGQMMLYSSDCGCDTDSLIDETVLQIDSSGTNANVISSQKVPLATIQP